MLRCAKTTCGGLRRLFLSAPPSMTANKVLVHLDVERKPGDTFRSKAGPCSEKTAHAGLSRKDLYLSRYFCPATAPAGNDAAGITQWGQLGEILGGVRFPCAVSTAVQLYATGLGSSDEQSQYPDFKKGILLQPYDRGTA